MNINLDSTIIVAMVTSTASLLGVMFTGVVTLRTQRKLKTNHGSKNIGDAVDRLTDRVLDVQEHQLEHGEKLDRVESKLDRHISDNKKLILWGTVKMREELEGGKAQ